MALSRIWANEDDREAEYRSKYDAYAAAINSFGQELGREHTTNKADRVVEFHEDVPTRKGVYIDPSKDRWGETPGIRTPCVRTDKVHAVRLSLKRLMAFLWFRQRIPGKFYAFIIVQLGNLATDCAAELDRRLDLLLRAKACLSECLVNTAPTTDGRMEAIFLVSKPPTPKELESFQAVLGGVEVESESRHVSNFADDLRRWANAGNHLPEDETLRGKFEAVLEGHQQTGSTVPRQDRKKCKENTHCISSLARRRPRNPKTGLLAVGWTNVPIGRPIEDVLLCEFDWYDDAPPWPIWEN